MSETISPNSSEQRRNEQISLARGEYIEKRYPDIFGLEEMGDPAVTITPQELTTYLADYESHLANKGLLKED